MKHALSVLFLIFATSAFCQEKKIVPPEFPTHRFEEFAKGVHFVTGTGTVFVQSNAMMIEGDRDVLIIDSHVTPAAADALIKAAKSITDKPVRYLANSHYHFDHAHGNQAFPKEVDIIGHEYTRERLSGDVLNQNTFLSFTQGIPEALKKLKAQLDAATGQRKETLQKRYDVQAAHLRALKDTVPTPPNVTFDSKMSMHYGGREVQFLFLGRGHTGGDVVIYLPEEGFAFTGDLMLPFLSYMGDGFVDEWPDTLEKLKSLDINTIFPGHGGPIKGKQAITNFQEFLRDLWTRTADAKKSGLSAAEAASTIDMTDHKANFRQVQGVGFDPRAIQRIYQRLDGNQN
jgi:glyoxylase-like metal-dependent hydrolase (beta-lactamase superfamily II)